MDRGRDGPLSMIEKRKIAFAAGSSITQTIIGAITSFILLKYILDVLGPAKLGVWSLVLAAASMVQVANLGMTGSIVKHVADCDALAEKEKMSAVIQTTIVSIAVFALLLIAAAYPVAKEYLEFALDTASYADAMEILPVALLAFFVYMIAAVYQGAIYGCDLIVSRNAILIVDSVSYLLLSVMLTPSYGLLGLAYARLAQNFLTLLLSVAVLRRRVSQLPLFPFYWSKSRFAEMFNYAANFQLLSLLTMLADPVTKGLLGRFGSVSMVGYYEIANRIVQVARALLANANQVLVPTFARLDKLYPGEISSTFIASYQVVFYLAVPGFCLLAISAPLVSEIMIGREEPFFIWSFSVLSGGWMLNTLAVPAYFALVGAGNLKANVISHLTMTMVNLILAYFWGRTFGGVGVISAWGLALASGGIILNVMYFRTHEIPWHNAIPKGSRLLTVLCLMGIVIAYGIWSQLTDIEAFMTASLAWTEATIKIAALSAIVLAFMLMVAAPMWGHPIRRKLWRTIIPMGTG